MPKKAFTLVELLVAMAIIAILLGLSVVGITIVQQNARDTQRRAKINEIEIALNGRHTGGNTLPADFKTATNAGNTVSAMYFSSTLSLQLAGALGRAASDTWTSTTGPGVTNYCYGVSGSIYVVGVRLESGTNFYKTNSGYSYSASGTLEQSQGSPALTCTDGNL